MNPDFRLHFGIPKPEGGDPADMTIAQMRAAIKRAGYRDSTVVRRCLHRAEGEGLNGEDTMTLIAYWALRMYDDTSGHLSDALMLSTKPLFVVSTDNKIHID